MKNIWNRFRPSGRGSQESGQNGPAFPAASARNPRDGRQGARREQVRYELVEDESEISIYFKRIYDGVAAMLQPPGHLPRARMERGRLPGDRSYFFVEPWEEGGWLFERAPYGWLITPAVKIVGQDTFMREGESWDVATLYRPDERKGLVRVSSRQLGQELISFSVYEHALLERLVDPV